MDIEKINEELLIQRNIIKMRLERLRDNKEREIAEYIQNEVLTKPGYVGYEAIRKDLENSYLAKEQELENQIKIIDNQIEENKKHIEKVEDDKKDFDKEEIEDAIVNYKNSGYRQNAYGYYFNVNIDEYDPDYRPWEDPLFNFKLNKVQKEKDLVGNASTTELDDVDFGSLIPTNEEEIDALEQVRPPLIPNEEIDENINVEEEVVEFDNICSMVETIHDDVVSCLTRTRTLKLEKDELLYGKNNSKGYESAGELELDPTQITLPNGTYINEKDIIKAFQNYRKQNKGRTFKVKGFDGNLQITRKSIRKFKKKLRECSMISLVKEKKLSISDIKRVYGKEKGEEYSKMIELGQVEASISAGNYVRFDEIINVINEAFTEKTPSWIDRFKQLFKRKESNVVAIEEETEDVVLEETSELTQETKENLNNQTLDEETHVVNSERDEFEVLKGFDLSKLMGKLNLEGMPYDDIKDKDLSKTETVPLETEKIDDIKQINLSENAVAQLESLDFDDIKTLDLRKSR